MALERQRLHFPTHFPDTEAYREKCGVALNVKEHKHRSAPLAKRMNYEKLGFKSPFRNPWEHVVGEWKHIIGMLMKDVSVAMPTPQPDNFYVLRDRSTLNLLHELLTQKTETKREEVTRELLKHPDALVAIRVSPHISGVPKQHATLCIPQPSDITLQKSNVNIRDNEVLRYEEPHHKGRKKDFPYVCKKHGYGTF